MSYEPKWFSKIDVKGYTPAAKRLIESVKNLAIMPPKDNSSYSLKKTRYVIDAYKSVSLSELQVNLCETLANNAEIEKWKAYIMAGYDISSYINEAKNVKRFKAHLTGMCNQKMTPELTAFTNYIKYGAAEKLLVDATWLLNEQVSLYEEVRREKQYTQAVRLLNDISYHVDVDSRVNNAPDVADVMDYAALLNAATKRLTKEPSSIQQGITIDASAFTPSEQHNKS